MNNISNENENVNNEELSYFSLNKRIYNEYKKKHRILLDIMLELANQCTYKNGLVGVYSEYSKTGLAKELGINKGNISYYLNDLEKRKAIKIFSEVPLVVQILEAPKMPKINDIKGLLHYVNANPQEFQFNTNLKRKEAFFKSFEKHSAEYKKEIFEKAIVPEGKDNTTTEEINKAFYNDKNEEEDLDVIFEFKPKKQETP